MNNKGFTLIELLAVIVVLAIVATLAVSTVLPLGTEAREKAFRLDATNAVKSAEIALDAYNLGDFKFEDTSTSKCYSTTTKKMCYTIDSLIDLQYYDMDKGTFSGKVVIDLTNRKSPEYTLYFKKNDEFRFVGLKYNDYNKNGNIDNADWLDEYETCSC